MKKKLTALIYKNKDFEIIIDTAREVQARIVQMVYLVSMNVLPAPLLWKSADGTFRTVSLPDLKDMCKVVSDHISGCYNREKEIVDFINKAETVEEMISWTC
jgi:hypothetical protein